MLGRIMGRIVADGPFGALGRIFAGLSLFALAERTLRFGVGAVFTTIVGYLDKVLAVLVGSWGDPLGRWIAELLAPLGLDLIIHPDWRYYFSLFGIYILRNGLRLLMSRDFKDVGFMLLVGGGLSALIHSLLLAAVPLDGSILSGVLIVVIPISLFLTYEAIRAVGFATFHREREALADGRPVLSWFGEIRYLGGHSLSQAVWALGWTGILVAVLMAVGYPHLKLAVVLFLLLLMIIDWVRRALHFAKWRAALNDMDWRDQFLDEPAGQVALGMIGVVFWCGLFILTNAGLSLYGL